jgi:hypothetical protein
LEEAETEVEEVEQFSPVDGGAEEVIVEEGEGVNGEWDDEDDGEERRGRSPGPWMAKRKPVSPGKGLDGGVKDGSGSIGIANEGVVGVVDGNGETKENEKEKGGAAVGVGV